MNARTPAAARASASSTSVGPGFLNAFNAAYGKMKALLRALFNRRVVGNLEQLSDHELSDIGLTREDLRFGKSVPFNADPTTELARRARRNACR
ncbi:MAG: DUF1127 domain-containing protein [Hoeflea sp.]|uniref:DUF1127 domain-containing protein n=1 Tax=Hoeflea sp. TaxID=1940281 RepID=UPI0027307E34|nr:DUF1127 domain-containing protein [Hoeflea sp.]MDP2118514.1 DUF1127 domain-containing protein [Hoeflea sp.]MDZ7603117.1 DUF1127 domain-containing protein [Hoeflea sp.]